MLLSWNWKCAWPAEWSAGTPYQTRVLAAAHAPAGALVFAAEPVAADEASAAVGSRMAAAVRPRPAAIRRLSCGVTFMTCSFAWSYRSLVGSSHPLRRHSPQSGCGTIGSVARFPAVAPAAPVPDVRITLDYAIGLGIYVVHS